MTAKVFTNQSRVYYEDTDAGGIVYYANYLKFCERARTEWLRGMGMSQSSMLEQKQGFVIKNIKGNYISSAKLDDLLTVTCIPTKARFASLKIFQQVDKTKIANFVHSFGIDYGENLYESASIG